MAACSPKDEILTLEYSTLKVPYELLNKKFRAVQKVLDREITQVTNSTSELTQALSKTSETDAEKLAAVGNLLGNVEQRLLSLKRKAEESLEEELECTRLCKNRLDHLKAYVSGKCLLVNGSNHHRLVLSPIYIAGEQTDGAKRTWQKNRVDRVLIDHLLRTGNYTAAQKLAESSGVEVSAGVSGGRDLQVRSHGYDAGQRLATSLEEASPLTGFLAEAALFFSQRSELPLS